MRRIVVVGGGVVGLNTAWALQRAGVPEITVVDSAAAPNGASIVNAGWIVPIHSTPVPAPGLVGQSLKWMVHADSPLYIKPNLRDPDLARWLFAFWRACNQRNYDHAVAALSELNRTTLALFDELAADGVRFQMEKAGLLMAFINPRNLEHELGHLERYKLLSGTVPKALWGAEARALEPALSDAVNGAFLIETERHIRPDTLTDGLIEWLGERNVDLRWNTRIAGLEADGQAVQRLITDGGESILADAVVIAAGARTSALTSQVGIKLPIQGGKGYSIDYATPPTQISHPISLFEAHMAMTPMGAWTRLAGTMELSGINTVVRPKRVAALAKGASQFIRNWPAEVGAGKIGSGLRPMTPDGMPIIDLLPGFGNVAVNTGHQMLGVVLAPASGVALADFLVNGRRPEVLEPFRADRF